MLVQRAKRSADESDDRAERPDRHDQGREHQRPGKKGVAERDDARSGRRDPSRHGNDPYTHLWPVRRKKIFPPACRRGHAPKAHASAVPVWMRTTWLDRKTALVCELIRR